MPTNILKHCNISTLKMEAVVSTKTSVTTTRLHCVNTSLVSALNTKSAVKGTRFSQQRWKFRF